jgi:hypothetical protein
MDHEVNISQEIFILTERSANKVIYCEDDGLFLESQSIGIGVLDKDWRLEGIIDCVVPLPAPSSIEPRIALVTLKALRTIKGNSRYPVSPKM